MERVFAFTDEFGAFGFTLDDKTKDTHFIISAVLVKEGDLDSFREKAELIREKYFQTGEIKSSKVGSNHHRRRTILSRILELPCHFFILIVDKKACSLHMTPKALQFKPPFYKFVNNLVHQDLRLAFKKITIIADEIGSNDYMKSFCKYIKTKQDTPDLFGEANFCFKNSKNDVGIQIADFVSGTLSYYYEENRRCKEGEEFYKSLSAKILKQKLYPNTYENFVMADSSVCSGYDHDLAELCYSNAAAFVNKHQNSTNEIEKAQVIVLDYLLFRFMNNSYRNFIYTKELLENIERAGIRMREDVFRMQVVAPLRDSNIIIASSNKGYKIPARWSEIDSYIKHDYKIIMPMLMRLKKCKDIILLSSLGKDILNTDEYKILGKIVGVLDL